MTDGTELATRLTEDGEPQRIAVLVLGMHRSGTSSVCGIATLLGAAPPRDLMSAASDNPKGFFEPDGIVALHEDALTSAGSAWDDWRSVPESWFQSVVGADYRRKIGAAYRTSFPSDVSLAALKDPRICRLLPMWKPLLAEMGWEPRALIALRNPLEVARSLRSRNGFAMERSLLIWLRHILDAEFHSRDLRRGFVRFDHLFRDWRQEIMRASADAGLSWPRLSDEAAVAVENFITPSLRHEHSDQADLNASPTTSQYVVEAWEGLQELALCGDGAGPRAKLDKVRREFDEACRAFGVILAAGDFTNRQAVAELQATLDAARQQGSDAERRAAEAQSARQDTAQLLQGANERIGTLTDEIVHREAEIDRHRHLRKEAERHQAAFAKQLAESTSDLAAQRHKMDNLEQRLASSVERLELLESERHALQRQLDDAISSSSALQTRLSDTQVQANAMKHRAEESEAYALSVEARLVQAQEANQQLQSGLTNARGHAEDLRSQVGRLGQAYEEIKFAKSEMERSASWLITRPIRAANRHLPPLGAVSLLRVRPAPSGRSRLRRTAAWLYHRISKDRRLVEQSTFFDRDWYLRRNPDVANSRVPPALHYLLHGWREGREPSPRFDGRWYATKYPDVAAARMNPLLHYLKYGRAEGRVPASSLVPGIDPGVVDAAGGGDNGGAVGETNLKLPGPLWEPGQFARQQEELEHLAAVNRTR